MKTVHTTIIDMKRILLARDPRVSDCLDLWYSSKDSFYRLSEAIEEQRVYEAFFQDQKTSQVESKIVTLTSDFETYIQIPQKEKTRDGRQGRLIDWIPEDFVWGRLLGEFGELQLGKPKINITSDFLILAAGYDPLRTSLSKRFYESGRDCHVGPQDTFVPKGSLVMIAGDSILFGYVFKDGWKHLSAP